MTPSGYGAATFHFPATPSPFVSPAAEGWVRILPGLLEAEGGLDGFFIARLVRRG